MKKLLLFLLTSGTALSTLAQTSQNLEGVQVNGRKKTQKERAEFKRHAQTTEVLTQNELNRNNPAYIEQTLGTVAGVQVDKRTQLGGQRIVIRGYGNDQKFNNWGIKAYYNGIPITTAEGVTVMDDIDFSLVNNIEVIKGPAATEYGAGVGGVARFYLQSPIDKGVTLTENFSLGSYNLLQSSSRVDVATDNSTITANYTHLESDGYRPHGASLKNFFSSFGEFKLNSKEKLSYFISHNYSHDEVSGQISYADYYAGIDNGNAAYIRKNARNDFLTTRFGLSHQYAITKSLTNYTSIFYSNSDYHNVSAGADGNSTNANFGLRSVFAWKEKVSKDFVNELDLGTELQESRTLTSSFRFTGSIDTPNKVQPIANGGSYFRYVTNQFSFFAIDRFTYVPWDLTLVAGVSANTIKYRRDDLLAAPGLIANHVDVSFERNFETAYNPHIALQKSWKNQIFQISYSQGYNAPTASSTYNSGLNVVNDTLKPEHAQMIEFSVQGLIHHTRLDYQFSVFRMTVQDKLTQLSGFNPDNGSQFSYWSNTGDQLNQGIELSLGYVWDLKQNPLLARVEPFVSGSLYDMTYTDFKTRLQGKMQDYSGKQIVGVPREKVTIGFDLLSPQGLYLNNTFNYMGEVYSDFANTNKVGSFTQYNAKLGYRHQFTIGRFSKKKLDLDVFVAGNNLSNQINYTFLFLGNSINDSDPNSGYPPGTATDVTPGPSKAYFFGGFGLKYRL
jgi:iron complex outermembrane receptor protein